LMCAPARPEWEHGFAGAKLQPDASRHVFRFARVCHASFIQTPQL